MKFILIVMLTTAGAPLVPEHYMLTSAEFDDQAACVNAIRVLNRNAAQVRVTATCVPKATPQAPAAEKPAASADEPAAPKE